MTEKQIFQPAKYEKHLKALNGNSFTIRVGKHLLRRDRECFYKIYKEHAQSKEVDFPTFLAAFLWERTKPFINGKAKIDYLEIFQVVSVIMNELEETQ